MKGNNLLSYVPLHWSALLERFPDLEGWFKGMFQHNELKMLSPKELLWNKPPPGDEKDDILSHITNSMISYCNALRGMWDSKMDLSTMGKHMMHGLPPSTKPHFVLPLLGRFKGEDGERLL